MRRFARFLLVAAILPGLTAFASQRTVRFAFRTEPDFAEKDKRGQRYGYYVEWVKRITSVLDWKIEWVDISWGDAQAKLASGEVDVIGPVGNMPENVGKVRITQFPIGCYRMTLRALKGSSLDCESPADLRGRTIGVPKGHPLNRGLREQLGEDYAACRIREYAGFDALIDAMKRGEVDAVFCPTYDQLPPTRMLLPSVQRMIHFGVRPNDDELVAALESAISSINESNPLFAGELWRMWRPNAERAHPVSFSLAERRWLARRRSTGEGIRIDFSSGSKVMSNHDAKRRIKSGPLNVMLETIFSYTGVQCEVLTPVSETEARQRLSKGESDVWFPSVGDIESSELQALGFRCHNVHVPQGVCMLRGERRNFMENGLRLGVLRQDRERLAAYRRFGLEAHMRLYGSPEELVDGLLNRDIDYFIYDFAHARALVRSLGVRQRITIRYSPMLRYRSKYSFFVSPTAEAELSTVLGRLLSSFSQDDFVDFALRAEMDESGFRTAFWTLFPYLAISVILLAVLVILVLWKSRRRLRHALREAKAAARAKTRFLATMSHELRTPLNAIIGFSELLDAPDASAERIREAADGITHASHSLLSLVNSVLDIAKLENDGMRRSDFRQGTCDLALIADEMTCVFSGAATQKGIGLSFAFPPGLVLGINPARVRQILLNLIGNSVKFTSAGSISVTVTYEREVFALSVVDTGAGISEDAIRSIFDPFVQDLSSRMAHPQQGTGLGLAIVKRMVDNAGGRVTLRSAIGKGTSVDIVMPDVARAEPLSEPPPVVGVSARPRQTVMVVDDTSVNVRVLELQLRKIGVSDVCTFSSATEALSALRGGLQVDLILSDVWMPDISGPEFARLVAAERPAIPVVAVTADVDASASFDVSAFRAVVCKPVTSQKLDELLKAL